jgi:hypothetical protein
MSLIKELQRLVQPDGPVAGRVLSVSGDKAMVSTASGQMEISASGILKVGDLVSVDISQATKKQRGSNTKKIFV